MGLIPEMIDAKSCVNVVTTWATDHHYSAGVH